MKIGWVEGHCARYRNQTCDWKPGHQRHEQQTINLICKIFWLAPLSWQPLYPTQLAWSGVSPLLATASLPPTSIVSPGTFYFTLCSVTFCIWTSISAPLRENFATFALSWVFTLMEAYFTSDFPRKTHGLAHAGFPLGIPMVANTVTAAAWNTFLWLLPCKTKKCKPERQEVILGFFSFIYLLSSAPGEWSSTTSLGNIDTTLLESFYFQNIGWGFFFHHKSEAD